MNEKKVAVLIGTRPSIIKMSPIIDELRQKSVPHCVIHSGQHFSVNMDRQIIDHTGIGEPDYQVIRPEGCESHAQQTAYMLTNIEDILLKEKPSIFLVCGDANTNLAGALAARKIHVKVGHVESGLRSFDWRMPEEHNRIIIDHISEYLFAPTYESKRNLEKDGVRGKIFVVGNTIVDATLKHAEIAKQKQLTGLLKRLCDEPYATLTLHREENVDDEKTLKDILGAVVTASETHGLKVVFPVHPRTRKRLAQYRIDALLEGKSHVHMIEPLGYLEFLALLGNSVFVMTDSGGIQEESCILKVPCLTFRESTERPETLDIGANRLAGTSYASILKSFEEALQTPRTDNTWRNPYGDGRAAKRIVEVCLHGHPENELEEGRP